MAKSILHYPVSVCLWFSVPLENCSHNQTSSLMVKDCKFWPMLRTHGHWALGFFSVPHLLWHGASVYNGYLRGPVTHYLPSVWQWSCHYLFLRLRSVAAGIRTSNLPLAWLICIHLNSMNTCYSLSIFSSQLYIYISLNYIHYIYFQSWYNSFFIF